MASREEITVIGGHLSLSLSFSLSLFLSLSLSFPLSLSLSRRGGVEWGILRILRPFALALTASPPTGEGLSLIHI